ncbi:MAG: CopG family transcriptional regulator [Synechococcaceae cyanobacterium]
MRTTLTLDDDLAEALNRAARLTGRSVKAVVNDTLRRGLAQSGIGTAGLEPFVVEPQSCGWMPGIDPLRLNQAVVHSNDSDFSRFPGLRWNNPLR